MSPIIDDVLQGYNGTIFAYGQTGAGKTYTIHGPGLEHPGHENSNLYGFRGLLPRALEFVFNSIHREMRKSHGIEYLVKCSFIEIYQETLGDLLNPGLQK